MEKTLKQKLNSLKINIIGYGLVGSFVLGTMNAGMGLGRYIELRNMRLIESPVKATQEARQEIDAYNHNYYDTGMPKIFNLIGTTAKVLGGTGSTLASKLYLRNNE